MFMFALAFASISSATAPTVKATWAEHDVAVETNPSSPFWRGAIPVFMDTNSGASPILGIELRSVIMLVAVSIVNSRENAQNV